LKVVNLKLKVRRRRQR